MPAIRTGLLAASRTWLPLVCQYPVPTFVAAPAGVLTDATTRATATVTAVATAVASTLTRPGATGRACCTDTSPPVEQVRRARRYRMGPGLRAACRRRWV